MKYLLMIIAIALAGMGLGRSAHAQTGLMFSPSYMFWSYEDKSNGSTIAEVTAQHLDVRLGYIMQGGIYAGGLYSNMNREDSSTDRKRTSYGASLGIVYNQFFIIGHYLLSSEYETASGTTLEDGTGFQIDIGYLFNVTGSFYAGPQVAIKNIDYDKINGNKVSADTSVSETMPYVTLAFIY